MDHGRNATSESQEEKFSVEDIQPDDDAAQDAGYDADVEIVRPYAIEEPGEETDQTPTSVATPKLLDATEQWQKELLNSLRGLYCDSDSTDTPPLVKHKRGKKRKPDSVNHRFHNAQQPSKDGDIDMGEKISFASPKRRRRKSTRSREDIMSHGSPLTGEAAGTTSSSVNISTSTPEDGGLSSLKREISAKDAMDLD